MQFPRLLTVKSNSIVVVLLVVDDLADVVVKVAVPQVTVGVYVDHAVRLPDIVLHPNPVFVVQVRAEVAAEHDGTARSASAVEVAAPLTVFCVAVASFALVTAFAAIVPAPPPDANDTSAEPKAGSRPAASVPEPMFVALVVSVEQLAAPLERSAHAACVTTPAPLPLSAPVIVPAPPRAAASVPEEMLLAFVVSVVADATNATPLVFVQVKLASPATRAAEQSAETGAPVAALVGPPMKIEFAARADPSEF